MESTKEWINQFNKKCAEFLGWIWVPHFLDETKGSWMAGINDSRNELKFDSDWNWIMEIVDKIESITHGEDDFEIEGIQLKYLIHQRLGKASKKAVIQAIDQFIDWYNKQKES